MIFVAATRCWLGNQATAEIEAKASTLANVSCATNQGEVVVCCVVGTLTHIAQPCIPTTALRWASGYQRRLEAPVGLRVVYVTPTSAEIDFLLN